MDNLYNRVDPSDAQYENAQYFIICVGGRDGFLTYEDAKRVCDTIQPCHKARVVKVCEEQKEKK